jgi:hypothetical protein
MRNTGNLGWISEVVKYSTTSLPAFDTEEKIFNQMHTKGVQFSKDYAFGVGGADLGYNLGPPVNTAEGLNWPTEYLKRYAEMEPTALIPAYTGSGHVTTSFIQFDWDANSYIIVQDVSQADCNAYISALRSAGWTYEETLSGSQVFKARNVAPTDSTTPGIHITVQFSNGIMRLDIPKINERRKGWLTYV